MSSTGKCKIIHSCQTNHLSELVDIGVLLGAGNVSSHSFACNKVSYKLWLTAMCMVLHSGTIHNSRVAI